MVDECVKILLKLSHLYSKFIIVYNNFIVNLLDLFISKFIIERQSFHDDTTSSNYIKN